MNKVCTGCLILKIHRMLCIFCDVTQLQMFQQQLTENISVKRLVMTHLYCIYHLNAAETTEILTDFSPANQRPAGTFPPLCTALINTLVSLISTSPRLPASSQFSPAGTPDGSRSVIFFTCIPDGDLSLLVASQLPPVAAVASSPRE